MAICYTALADQYNLPCFSFCSYKTVLTQNSSYSQVGVGIREQQQEAPRTAALSRWGPGPVLVTAVPCSQPPPPSLPPGCALELVPFLALLMTSSESASSRPVLGVGLGWGWGCPALPHLLDPEGGFTHSDAWQCLVSILGAGPMSCRSEKGFGSLSDLGHPIC